MAKSDHYKLADYVLSNNHERDSCIEKVKELKKDGFDKREIRRMIYDHIYYSAIKTLHGRGEAGKLLTEVIKEGSED